MRTFCEQCGYFFNNFLRGVVGFDKIVVGAKFLALFDVIFLPQVGEQNYGRGFQGCVLANRLEHANPSSLGMMMSSKMMSGFHSWPWPALRRRRRL